MGITHKDWELLGSTALEACNFEIARKSYIHTRDFKYLSLIHQLQVTINFVEYIFLFKR